MCLILLSYKTDPYFTLILAGNRDEYYDRPTASLGYFKDNPSILGGRDLQGKGTWLGITRNGRIAALTNFRDPDALRENPPSRGHLVSDFLHGNMSPFEYLQRIHETADSYSGFNLIVGNMDTLYYYSNMEGKATPISPGIHGLSNHLLNVPWPKVEMAKQGFTHAITPPQDKIDKERIFQLLSDDTLPPDEDLPDTRVGLMWERLLAPIFIKSDFYGTRSSAILTIDNRGTVAFTERSFTPKDPAKTAFSSHTRTISFSLPSGP